jgi:hypothetical protein
VKALTPDDIRNSFVNATDEQLARMPLPGLHEVIWDEREYLGWRDAKAHQRGYLVHWRGDRAIGIILRASDFSLGPGISAMCSLCRITQPSRQVTLFTAPRAGQAGLEGNTVGTYICDDLACSMLIRILPSPSPMQPPPEEVLARRSAGLLDRVQGFTADVARAR